MPDSAVAPPTERAVQAPVAEGTTAADSKVAAAPSGSESHSFSGASASDAFASDASTWAPRSGPPEERKPLSRGLIAGWALLGLVVPGLLAAGWFARSEVVATVPEARVIYDSLGVPLAVEEPQLTLQDVVSLRRTVEGEEQLQVQGVVSNEGKREAAVPEMRAVIRDSDGSELHSWTFRPDSGRLKPGESTEFSTSTANPPVEGSLALIFLGQE